MLSRGTCIALYEHRKRKIDAGRRPYSLCVEPWTWDTIAKLFIAMLDSDTVMWNLRISKLILHFKVRRLFSGLETFDKST